jgi:uncharacterized membrane protein
MKKGIEKKIKLSHQRNEHNKVDASFWQFLVNRNPYMFAHHPLHPVFQNHVWNFNGMYLCRGCVVTFAGMIVGLFLYLLTPWLKNLTDEQVGLIFLAMLLPSIITSLLPIRRTLKLISRFVLGILITSAIVMVLITDSLTVKLIIIGIYFSVKIPLEWKRRLENRSIEMQAQQKGKEF